MQNEIYFQAILSLLLLGGLFLVIYLFKNTAIDSYRQSLFALRDEFFDEAMNGKIGFSDPAYLFVRDLMNKHIRFSHRISIWLLFGLALIYIPHRKELDQDVDGEWKEATQNLNADQLHLVATYKNKADVLFLKYILFFSPELLPVFALMLIPIFFTVLVLSVSRVRRLLVNSNKVAVYELRSV